MAKAGILRRRRLDWPLLGKELIEQAARKQMYVMRVIYAFVLFGAFIFYYARHVGAESLLTLGHGREVFEFVVTTQLITIFLFLPPMMAGTIAREKERDTLGLLFLTDLTPVELVLQKYVGRLIPMLTLLFLSLPLLAMSYALGGVSMEMLLISAESLFFTCLAVGALALECSSHEATTFQALIRCWGICLAFAACCLQGPLRSGFYSFNFTGRPTPFSFYLLLPMSLSASIYLVPTALFLWRAVENLEPRAFVRGRNPFAQQFKQLDQYWRDLRKLVRAILRKRDQEAYSMAKQVVRNRAGWGGDNWSLSGFLFAKMQVPTILAIAVIIGFVVFIVLFFSVMMDPKASMPFSFFVAALWILALLTIPIQSANAIASERINERLNAMLTTPLTGTELLNEWLGPVQRWIQFITRPLFVLFFVEALVKFKNRNPQEVGAGTVVVYFCLSLLTAYVYPKLVQWCCLWIGMKIRQQVRAMMTALLSVVAWCFIPVALSNYIVQAGLMSPYSTRLLSFISPMTVIHDVERIGRFESDTAWGPVGIYLAVAHLALAALLLFLIRRRCLTHADRYLGRI